MCWSLQSLVSVDTFYIPGSVGLVPTDNSACYISDDDLITLFDTSDVSFAIQSCNRQLRLTLFGK